MEALIVFMILKFKTLRDRGKGWTESRQPALVDGASAGEVRFDNMKMLQKTSNSLWFCENE